MSADCPDCLAKRGGDTRQGREGTSCPDLSPIDPQGICDECAFASDAIGVGSGAGIPWPITPAMCRPTEEEEENNDRD